MSADLAALYAAHKPAVLAAGAAGVTALVYLRSRKTGAAPAGASPGARVPGTSPAAAVVSPASTGIGGYDSSAFDAYNALQPEIDQILAQQRAATAGSGAGTTAPAPLASSLLQPTYNGQYVRFADGQIDEVESDGSLLWLNQSENTQAFGGGPWQYGKFDQLVQNHPDSGVYNTGDNLIGRATGAATPVSAAKG